MTNRADSELSDRQQMSRVPFAYTLNEQRDDVHLKLILQSSIIIPMALILFIPGVFNWWLGLGYMAVCFWFGERFTTMFHCALHRRLFKKEYPWAENLLQWVWGPLYGQIPWDFYIHHTMHHVENNLPDDLSSTMPYQRDSFGQFLLYFWRYAAFELPDLTRYQLRKGNLKFARRIMFIWPAYIGMCIALAFYQWQATLIVFIIPLIVVRYMMMLGNWFQHAFVDPADPANPYKNSCNVIEERYSTACCNAFYHIMHHLQQGIHYTELDKEFKKNVEEYGRQDAVVFDGVSPTRLIILLFNHNYSQLAKHFVRLPGAPERSEEEVIALLQYRLAPISSDHSSVAATS